MRIHGFSWFVIFVMAIASICNTYLNGIKSSSSFNLGFDFNQIINIAENSYIRPFFETNSGFVKIPNGSYTDTGKVIFIVPLDADNLVKTHTTKFTIALAKRKIPFEQVDHIDLEYSADANKYQIQKVQVALAGEAPVVIVKGWIKANPNLSEIIEKYYKK